MRILTIVLTLALSACASVDLADVEKPISVNLNISRDVAELLALDFETPPICYPESEQEGVAWQVAVQSNSPYSYSRFLALFPDTDCGSAAQLRMSEYQLMREYQSFIRAYENNYYDENAALTQITEKFSEINSNVEVARNERAAQIEEKEKAARRTQLSELAQLGAIIGGGGRLGASAVGAGVVALLRILGPQVAFEEPPCLTKVEPTCIFVPVLYGTTRKIDATLTARETEGGDAIGNTTPFLDELDAYASSASLGVALVTVPSSISRKNSDIERGGRNLVGRLLGKDQVSIPLTGLTFNLSEKLDGEVHFVFRGYGAVTEDEFKQGLRSSESAFVYVHGYQTTFIDAVFRAAQLKVVSGFDGEPVVFSWPSINGLSEENYHLARANARNSVGKLKEFLQLVSDNIGGGEVHVVAHSMGNYALLQALQELKSENGQEAPDKIVDQVIMAAPDVSVAEYRKTIDALIDAAEGVTLYASGKDAAMKVSVLACNRRYEYIKKNSADVPMEMLEEAETLFCDQRAGTSRNGAPAVLVNGVDEIDITDVDESSLNPLSQGNHNYHFASPQVFFDIGVLMNEPDKKKPDARGPYIEPDPQGRGFWRFFK